LNATSQDNRAASAAALKHRIKTIVGVSTDVVVTDPGGVPRSQGKAVRVVDNRKGER
jgi:phenylacetate-CoA ligase